MSLQLLIRLKFDEIMIKVWLQRDLKNQIKYLNVLYQRAASPIVLFQLYKTLYFDMIQEDNKPKYEYSPIVQNMPFRIILSSFKA